METIQGEYTNGREDVFDEGGGKQYNIKRAAPNELGLGAGG